jgi:protein-S-isoprenylcysteine O-methyltransferase
MRLPDPSVLGAIYGLSEVGLAITRRSGSQIDSRDQNSLVLLWGVILASLAIGISIQRLYPAAALPHRRAIHLIGLSLFVGGIILRWYSIVRLGRFFTVDVSIAREHRLIDSGPYRFIRHPSYTGALIAFLGFGLSLGNWLSILLVTLPILGAFLCRIQIEESVLLESLGDDYRAYIRRTKRLIPFVY